jgi:hypothetical protein
MNDKEKKEPKEPLRIPLDFEQTLADMLKIAPPPEQKKRGGDKKAGKGSKKVTAKK